MEEDQENQVPNNVRLLQLAISNSFKHIGESVSEDNFVETLSILKTKPHVIKRLHKALIKELYESMDDELEDILREGSLETGLAKVSKLTENADAYSNETVWRPPGDVTLHLRSLDAERIKEESDKLEKVVHEIEEENAILMNKVIQGRSKVCATHNKVTRSLSRSSHALKSLEERLQELEKCLSLLDSE